MSLSTDSVLEECITVRDYVRLAMSQCAQASVYLGHGTDNYWDEALHLVLGTLSLDFNNANHLLDARVLPHERALLWERIQKRILQRIPVPYLTQQAWFFECPFYVDQRVIIPRSPLAELIKQGFAPWLEAQNIHRILDMCTGSGCIAVACALQCEDAHIDAVDLSERALEVASINCERYGLEERITLIQSNLFEALSKDVPYDIIIANPPYVSERTYASLPPEYAHEPELALKTEEEGLALVITILKQAKHYLGEKGVLVVELGNGQLLLEERFPHVPFVWLHFNNGGEGVFLLSASELREFF
jgi:ribosomal protein L3 glutamine methyltransferase